MTLADLVLTVKRATVLASSDRLDRQLERDERRDVEALVELSERRSIEHARFAMEHTKFYRDRYSAAGFTSDDLRDPAAFESLPIIEKAEVRAAGADFQSDEVSGRNTAVSTTGGSTGQPLRLLRDRRFPARALEWRLMRWWGVRPSENVAIVTRHVRSARADFIHDLQWWPSKRQQLNAYRMDDTAIDEFIRRWNATRPAIMIGYVGGITELARALEQRGVVLPAPKAIAVTAAPLIPAQRAVIESVFGAPVYDHYRSAEIPWMGGECREQHGLHVFQDVRRLEVVDTDGRVVPDGEVGEVVVSDLTNRIFPLIRYRLGDRTSRIAESCPCGVTLPRITPVAGRVSEAIRLPDGQIVAGEGLTQLFSHAADAVRQFQIHQLADRSIVVRIVLQPGRIDHRAVDTALAQLRDITGGQVPIDRQVVDQIEHDGGKVRYIRSDVTA